jgi:hypothetical protein
LSTSAADPSGRLGPALKRRIVRESIEFIVERYALADAQRSALEQVPIRWRRARGPSRFYLRACRGFDGPHILISVGRGATVRWHVYRRVRAALVTPAEGIPIPAALHASLALVHELTHAVQHGMCGTPRRRYSEVETTANEIEFIRRAAPDVHAQLVPVQARRKTGRRPAEARKPVIPRRSALAGLASWFRAFLRG